MRLAVVARPAVSCPRCGSRSCPDDVGYCILDILFMARIAARAYDGSKVDEGDELAMRATETRDATHRRQLMDIRVARTLAWIECGHERHGMTGFLGCPFCVITAP